MSVVRHIALKCNMTFFHSLTLAPFSNLFILFYASNLCS